MNLTGRRSHADQGSTLIIAMMATAIAAGLSLVITSVAITQNRSSGVDRQRTIAVSAAEGGIDATYAAIQSSGANLPCRWPTSGSADMKAFPDPTQVVVTVTYYAVAGGPALPCTAGVVAAAALPTSALITSTATLATLSGNSTVGTRTMQASVNLVPTVTNALSKAMFGESSITGSNNAKIFGSTGSNANLYTNGNVNCSNNQDYHGAVIAPRGPVSIASCSIDGDVWARDNITSSGNVSIGGRVISSAGSVSLTGNTSVSGTVLAAGAISWSGCATAGKCFANQGTSTPAPPYEQFPVLRGDAATLQAWADAGWTVINDNACGSNSAAFGAKIKSTYAPRTGKTLLRTTCSVQFSNNKEIKFAGDFALFASGSGGISSSNNVTLDSTGPVRNVYLVVPYDAASRPCTAPSISTTNNFGTKNITLLVYSPCDVTYSNNSGENRGQIYSGNRLKIENNFSLTFAQLPVFGIDPASLPVQTYRVDILYKKEVRNP